MGLFDDVVPQQSEPGASAGGLFSDVLDQPPQKSSALRRGIADPALSLLKGAISVPEAAVGLADIPTLGIVGKAAEGLGFRPKEAKAEIDTWYSPEQQAAKRAVQESKGFVPTLQAAVQNPSVIGHTVLESAPSMLGGAGIARGLLGAGGGALSRAAGSTAAPIIAGAAGEGAVGAGMAAEQIRQETPDGMLSPAQSAAAAASGIVTGLLGAIGGGLARKLGLSDVDTMLAGGVRRAGARSLPARVVGGAISEGVLEEMPQSAQEQAWQNVALGRPTMEGVAEQAAIGGLAGAAMGGLGGTIPAAPRSPAPGPLQKALDASPTPPGPANTGTPTPPGPVTVQQAAADNTTEPKVGGDLPQPQQNTQAAPESSPPLVSTADLTAQTNQAESAGVPISQQQEGAVVRGNETEVAEPAGAGQQAQPTEAADSAKAEREWRDFVASDGRSIGPRQLAVVRAQFMRRRMLNAGIEEATARVEDARQREVAQNRMAILDALPLTTAGNTIRHFAASLRKAGIRDFRVSPEERQLIARRIAARDTLQSLDQVPPNELTLPEKRTKQAQPTMPRIESLRRRAAMPGVRIVGNRMLDRHGKRLATLSADEAAELLPKPKQDPARTVEDTELADFIKSESADLGKRRAMLRSLQALRQQKQAEADKADLEDLIEAERADLRERFARLQDAQAAARAKKPFVIPPLTTPAQPTTTRVMEQKPAQMPLPKTSEPAKQNAQQMEGSVGDFEYAGLRIYQTRIRIGGNIETRWAVQIPENKLSGSVAGDTLHGSIDEAKKAADEHVRRYESEQRSTAEIAEQDAARKNADEARKAANRVKSIAERLADSRLNKEVMENGEVMTRRQWVERKIADGQNPSVTQENKIQPMSRAQFNRASNEEQDAHERRVKLAGKKDVHWIGDYKVTKVEHDYALTLLSARDGAKQTASAEVREATTDQNQPQAPSEAAPAPKPADTAPVIPSDTGGDRKAEYEAAAKRFLEGPLTTPLPPAKAKAVELIPTDKLSNVRPRPIERKVAPAKAFAAQFRAMLSVAGNKDIRRFINGVHIEDSGRLVATDGSRLAVVDGADVSSVPAKPEKLTLATVLGRDGQWVEGKFPDYRRVMPEEYKTQPETVDATAIGDAARGIVRATRYTSLSTIGGGPMPLRIGNLTQTYDAQYIADAADLFRAFGYSSFEARLVNDVGRRTPLYLRSPDGKVQQVIMPRTGDPGESPFAPYVVGQDVVTKAPDVKQDAKKAAAKPAPAAAPSEPTSNTGELPAAEASTANTPASEPLKNLEELPAKTVAPTADVSTAKIYDFGEKLDGARKDYATQLKDAMDVDVGSEPLSKSWPEPDYQKLLDGGADKYMVAFVRAARDELPTKPQKGWKLAGWVKQAEMLRDLAQKLLSGNISASRVREMLQDDRFRFARDSVGNRAELYEIVGHSRSLKGVTFAQHFFSLYKGQENVSKWVVEQKAKATAFSNWPRELAVGNTKEEVLTAFKEKFASLELGSNAKRQPQFVVYRKRGEAGAWIGKKIGREYIDLHKTEDVAEARKYMAENLSALEAKLARYKETPFERNPENQPRVGDDHRNGAPATPNVFAETFSFRGVQFGNYVEQGRRQSDLNEAFDGLMDLAAVLGVPPRALSLNGRLGLAFGSRGRGGRNAPAAHFEPDRVVINLTKGGGPGSLAHEWWHSLDNYFAKQSNDKSVGFVTSGAETNGMRDALRAAFNAVKLATSADAYKRRSAELDKRRSKPYWNMPEERSARAFEGYVIAKLFDQGAANDYLVNVVSNEAWDITEDARSEFFGGGESPKTYPYPTVDEMPVVRAAFDEFFKTVETKAGEDGNVVLYSGELSQDASPADRAVYAMAAEGKTAAEILAFLGKASRRPFNRYLANALKNLGASSTITLDEQGGFAFGNRSYAQKYAAAYNSRTDTVALFTPREAERHILHELVHAETMKAINAGGPAAAGMRALFRHVQKSGKLDGKYGMSSIDEFVAEAFSNPRFQEALRGVPAPAGSTLKSAWQWFVRVVARVVGIKTKGAETALDRALTVGAELMRENSALDSVSRSADGKRYSAASQSPFDGREVAATPLKPGTTTLMVDGVERPALNGVDRYYPSQTLSDVVLARQSAMSKSRPYGNPGDSERISDLLIGRSFSLHGLGGLDVPAQREVLNSVVALGNDKEVVRSVVEFIPVDVMNVLRRENGSAESIFSDKTVLKKFLSADGNGSVATAIDIADALVAGIARVAAKRPIPGWLVPGRLGKGNSATGANVSDEAHFSTVPQIKATGNSGAFSPSDPDIRFNLATDWQQSPVAQEVAKAFKAATRSDASLSWLNSVQTQYHKAETLAKQGKPMFKRVFDLGQKFLSDISRFAVMAENSAPTLFHQIRSLSDARQAAGAVLGGDFGRQRNADVRAIAAPLYEGTLYGGGNPMAGLVWTDEQLRSRFGLTDRQITLYQEAREAVQVSMDEMAKSLISRHAKREHIIADTSGSLQEVAENVRDTLNLRADVLEDKAQGEHDYTMRQAEDLRKAGEDKRAGAMEGEAADKLKAKQADVSRIRATVDDVLAIAAKAQKLQDAGYFPLMRFGRHTVTAKDEKGNVRHFSMHDGIPLVPRSGQVQANRLAEALREEHPDWTVTTGLMNPEKYKLYQGMNVDALQLFSDHLDDETRQTYQELIRLSTNDRSALRRMLKREGTPGFDRDVRRTLASFILSNARYTSSAYHLADMAKAAEQAEEDGGDVGAEAVKLYDYVTKPQEEAAKLRGFLFFNFLGGSLAAAMVNATQVPMMTFPRLSQYESAGKLAARLARAARMATKNPQDIPGEVGVALRQAEEDGITAPHQIYEMTATASNNIFAGSMAGGALLRAWGAPFAVAESFNRRATFIAAWQIGNGMTAEQLQRAGAGNATEFAEKMVHETQGIYNRGNRVNLGRGTVGAVVMTFKQFGIMYLEMLSRLPPKQKAIMVGMLILAAGAGGLPFAEDVEDIIDTIGQWLGYRTNTRRTIRRGLADIAGQRAADIAMNGVLSQMGIDLHSRLGLQNLIPGSALLKPSTTDKSREFQDLLGPAASVVAAMGQALQDIATGRPDKAALAMAPVAVQNAVKGAGMLATGSAADMRGKPTVPVSAPEAVAKAVGFNPKSVADYGVTKRDIMQDERLIDVTRERFTAAIVDAIMSDNETARREAVQEVAEWNRQNPEARITINPAAIRRRVRDMRAEGPARVVKSLSPSLRQQARKEFSDAQG